MLAYLIGISVGLAVALVLYRIDKWRTYRIAVERRLRDIP